MKKRIKSIFEMRHFLKKAGKIPGDLEAEGTVYEKAALELIKYHKDHFEEVTISDPAQLTASQDTRFCNWINIVGLKDIQTIQNIGNIFTIHQLTLEDVINTDHLPKCDISDQQLFFTLKYPIYDAGTDSLLEMNMANVNNNMNRVMKTLTIVATIFIPLTFVVGIYGMNFQYMPELKWEYGYPAVLLGMMAIVAVMVIFMKRKKWF